MLSIFSREKRLQISTDPWIPKYKRNGERYEGVSEINADIIKGYDLILVATAMMATIMMIRKK